MLLILLILIFTSIVNILQAVDKHKDINDISHDEIEKMRKEILAIANENKKIIKKENYIWFYK